MFGKKSSDAVVCTLKKEGLFLMESIAHAISGNNTDALILSYDVMYWYSKYKKNESQQFITAMRSKEDVHGYLDYQFPGDIIALSSIPWSEPQERKKLKDMFGNEQETKSSIFAHFLSTMIINMRTQFDDCTVLEERKGRKELFFELVSCYGRVLLTKKVSVKCIDDAVNEMCAFVTGNKKLFYSVKQCKGENLFIPNHYPVEQFYFSASSVALAVDTVKTKGVSFPARKSTMLHVRIQSMFTTSCEISPSVGRIVPITCYLFGKVIAMIDKALVLHTTNGSHFTKKSDSVLSLPLTDWAKTVGIVQADRQTGELLFRHDMLHNLGKSISCDTALIAQQLAQVGRGNFHTLNNNLINMLSLAAASKVGAVQLLSMSIVKCDNSAKSKVCGYYEANSVHAQIFHVEILLKVQRENCSMVIGSVKNSSKQVVQHKERPSQYTESVLSAVASKIFKGNTTTIHLAYEDIKDSDYGEIRLVMPFVLHLNNMDMLKVAIDHIAWVIVSKLEKLVFMNIFQFCMSSLVGADMEPQKDIEIAFCMVDRMWNVEISQSTNPLKELQSALNTLVGMVSTLQNEYNIEQATLLFQFMLNGVQCVFDMREVLSLPEYEGQSNLKSEVHRDVQFVSLQCFVRCIIAESLSGKGLNCKAFKCMAYVPRLAARSREQNLLESALTALGIMLEPKNLFSEKEVLLVELPSDLSEIAVIGGVSRLLKGSKLFGLAKLVAEFEFKKSSLVRHTLEQSIGVIPQYHYECSDVEQASATVIKDIITMVITEDESKCKTNSNMLAICYFRALLNYTSISKDSYNGSKRYYYDLLGLDAINDALNVCVKGCFASALRRIMRNQSVEQLPNISIITQSERNKSYGPNRSIMSVSHTHMRVKMVLSFRLNINNVSDKEPYTKMFMRKGKHRLLCINHNTTLKEGKAANSFSVKKSYNCHYEFYSAAPDHFGGKGIQSAEYYKFYFDGQFEHSIQALHLYQAVGELFNNSDLKALYKGFDKLYRVVSGVQLIFDTIVVLHTKEEVVEDKKADIDLCLIIPRVLYSWLSVHNAELELVDSALFKDGSLECGDYVAVIIKVDQIAALTSYVDAQVSQMHDERELALEAENNFMKKLNSGLSMHSCFFPGDKVDPPRSKGSKVVVLSIKSNEQSILINLQDILNRIKDAYQLGTCHMPNGNIDDATRSCTRFAHFVTNLLWVAKNHSPLADCLKIPGFFYGLDVVQENITLDLSILYDYANQDIVLALLKALFAQSLHASLLKTDTQYCEMHWPKFFNILQDFIYYYSVIKKLCNQLDMQSDVRFTMKKLFLYFDRIDARGLSFDIMFEYKLDDTSKEFVQFSLNPEGLETLRKDHKIEIRRANSEGNCIHVAIVKSESVKNSLLNALSVINAVHGIDEIIPDYKFGDCIAIENKSEKLEKFTTKTWSYGVRGITLSTLLTAMCAAIAGGVIYAVLTSVDNPYCQKKEAKIIFSCAMTCFVIFVSLIVHCAVCMKCGCNSQEEESINPKGKELSSTELEVYNCGDFYSNDNIKKRLEDSIAITPFGDDSFVSSSPNSQVDRVQAEKVIMDKMNDAKKCVLM